MCNLEVILWSELSPAEYNQSFINRFVLYVRLYVLFHVSSIRLWLYCSNIFKSKERSLFKFIPEIPTHVLLKYADIINFVFMHCMVYSLFPLNTHAMCSDTCETVLFIELDLHLIFCDGISLHTFYVGWKNTHFLNFLML